MTPYLLTALAAFLVGRLTKRPGPTPAWMKSRYSADYSRFPEMRKYR